MRLNNFRPQCPYSFSVWKCKLKSMFLCLTKPLKNIWIHLDLFSCVFTLRWKNSQAEGLRVEMSYCRKHFLNRTALITIEVRHMYLHLSYFWQTVSSTSFCLTPCVCGHFPPRKWSMSWWRWWSRQASAQLAPRLPTQSCRRLHSPSSRFLLRTQYWQQASTTAWLGYCAPPLWMCSSEWPAQWKLLKARLRSIPHLLTATCRRTAGCCTRRR